ncbi:MAG: hypothetical protein AB9895_00075 [Negativicutes bacterium]
MCKIENNQNDNFDNVNGIQSIKQEAFNDTVPSAIELEIHEWALLFPPMTEDEFENLVKDIEINGQYDPIILFDGKIVEGRNRYLACEKLKIQPRTTEWTGNEEELFQYVFSKNFTRRNLNANQKAMIAAKCSLAEEKLEAKLRQGNRSKITLVKELTTKDCNSGKATQKAAEKIGGTNRQYIADAKFVQEKAPELVDDIFKGNLTIPKAIKIAKQLDSSEEREEALQEVLNKKKVKSVINDIKFKRNPAHEISVDSKQLMEPAYTTPAVTIFMDMRDPDKQDWKRQDELQDKIKQIAHILGIKENEIWYCNPKSESETKALPVIIKSVHDRLNPQRLDKDGQRIWPREQYNDISAVRAYQR